jgi:hypothetical protein
MILIAHRGNTIGPNIEKENHPDYIDEAIKKGFDVEVDIRGSLDSALYLGHDMPQYKVTPDWLFERASYLWIHAKDIMALYSFNAHSDLLNVFWHQHDDHTLTKNGYIWAYPGSVLTPHSICVMPENVEGKYNTKDLKNCAGICSDFIETYK